MSQHFRARFSSADTSPRLCNPLCSLVPHFGPHAHGQSPRSFPQPPAWVTTCPPPLHPWRSPTARRPPRRLPPLGTFPGPGTRVCRHSGFQRPSDGPCHGGALPRPRPTTAGRVEPAGSASGCEPETGTSGSRDDTQVRAPPNLSGASAPLRTPSGDTWGPQLLRVPPGLHLAGVARPPPGGVRRCPVWFRLAHLPDDQRTSVLSRACWPSGPHAPFPVGPAVLLVGCRSPPTGDKELAGALSLSLPRPLPLPPTAPARLRSPQRPGP